MLPTLAARIDDPIRFLSLAGLRLEATTAVLHPRGQVKPTTLVPPKASEGPRRYDATQLFSEHGAFVAKFLWRMGAPDSEIEDLVQDVFLVAHLRGGFVEGPARPTTWLASIAFRLWSSERRRFRRHAEMSNDEAVARAEARGPTPAEALANAESLRRVREVLEQLEERGRAILILVDLEGASCVEVAEALNIPIGTVYSRLHGARKRFAEAYEKLTKEVGVGRPGGAV